jgi:hypothetical protein
MKINETSESCLWLFISFIWQMQYYIQSKFKPYEDAEGLL